MKYLVGFSPITALSAASGTYAAAPIETSNTAHQTKQDKATLPIQQVYTLLENELHVEEPTHLEIKQQFSSGENPNQATVTVTETGYRDDSVAGQKIDYEFKLQQGQWKLIKQDKSYLCARGENTTAFQTRLCP